MNLIESPRLECESQAANIIAERLNVLASQQPHVILGICGGTSVKGIFSNLLNKEIQWNKVHIFMIDERCVSLNSLESNYKLAYDAFIQKLIEQHKLPQENAHPFIYDSANAFSGLKKYDNDLSRINNRKFDLILLSAGEDGHVAALYPNHRSISNESTTFFMMNDSPKPPKDRMTASRKLMQTAKVAVLLFFGQRKQQAFDKFNNPSLQVKDCPAKLITSIPESYVFRGD